MKIAIAAVMFFISLPAISAGPYDGIWNAQNLGYISVHENNGQIIIIRLQKDLGYWEALMGPRNGNTIRLESIVSSVNVVLNVTMTSDTTFTATQESCTPDTTCILPDGFSFTGLKIF